MDQETFDIRTDMDVYGPDGEKIGRVAEIAGFGSDSGYRGAGQQSTAAVTQAQTGTGYFKVDRTGVPGKNDGSLLVVPFHGIAEVTPERGITLNDTIIAALQQQAEPRETEKAYEPKKARWWSMFLPG